MMRRDFLFRPRDKVIKFGRRTRIMGVVNVTPDSFSDKGRVFERSSAVDYCLNLVEKGVDVLDLGGESSRPGAEPVSAREELDRVLPVLEEVRKHVFIPISIDTYKTSVAEEALRAGADLINDISAFHLDPEMPRVIREWNAGIILMHMRGTPRTMQQLSPSPDILKEVQTDLQTALNVAFEYKIARDKIILDPGIGFGKKLEDNLKILNQLSFLEVFQLPILVGTSRKSFLGEILGLPIDRRLWGTAASVVVAILRGAHMVRVHDPEVILQVILVTNSIQMEKSSQ